MGRESFAARHQSRSRTTGHWFRRQRLLHRRSLLHIQEDPLMNNLTPLTRTAEPWFHLWTTARDEARDSLVSWELAAPGKRVARVVRGVKCSTATKLFDEFAAALQFPDYFGENWDAFSDCFADLR